MPRKPTTRVCVTCGVLRRHGARGECAICYSYRRRYGVTRPYGAQDGRPIGTAAASRLRSGSAGSAWKGDGPMTPAGGRKRARTLIPVLGDCELCGTQPARERHHWNMNQTDNRLENLVQVCSTCHHVLHAHGYGPPPGRKPPPSQADKNAWQRARTLIKTLGTCALCGNRPAACRHHWNLDPQDNRLENLTEMCRSCHRVVHEHAYGDTLSAA